MRFAPVAVLAFTSFSLASTAGSDWDTHVAQGMEAYQLGHYQCAETSFRLALTTAAGFAPDNPRIPRAHNNLAAALHSQGRYADAHGEYQLALEWWNAHPTLANPDESRLLNNLASTLRIIGRYADARRLAEQAIASAARAGNPGDQANAAFSLGEILRASGDLEPAAHSLRDAVSLAREAHGPGSLMEAHIRQSLAMLSLTLGDTGVAREHIVAAWPIFESKLEPEHPTIATAASNLAQVLVASGRHADALGPLETSLRIWRARLGPTHPNVAIALNNLGQWQFRDGQVQAAENSLRAAIAIWEKALGPAHPDTARAYLNLGVLFQSQAKWHGAEALFQRALSAAGQTAGPSHPVARDARELLAQLYDFQRRTVEAKRVRQSASRR